MTFIDTHCHLDFPEFDADRQEVVRRAQLAGLSQIVNIGSSLKGSRDSLKLAEEYDCIWASAGLHPHEADSFNPEVAAELEGLCRGKKVVAIGETGLDYFKNYSRQDHQRVLFEYTLDLAVKLRLPLVFHCRQAEEDFLRILKTRPPLPGVVHCFSGDEGFLEECLVMGLYVSFTCNITYGVPPRIRYRVGGGTESRPAPTSSGRSLGIEASGPSLSERRDKKAQGLRRMVELAPLEKMMLETDAPFLPPEGMRGRRNEPLYVKDLAQEIARIKGIDVEKVADVTTANAKRFFGLP